MTDRYKGHLGTQLNSLTAMLERRQNRRYTQSWAGRWGAEAATGKSHVCIIFPPGESVKTTETWCFTSAFFIFF